MIMKRIVPMIILGLLLLAGGAAAQLELLSTERHGRVTFISGGIGKQEQDFLRRVRARFNLHLLFAVKGSGAYIGGAKVSIDSAVGGNILDAYANGPQMFVKLQPGPYRVTAEHDGFVLTRKLTVRSRSGADVVYAFPPEAAH